MNDPVESHRVVPVAPGEVILHTHFGKLIVDAKTVRSVNSSLNQPTLVYIEAQPLGRISIPITEHHGDAITKVREALNRRA